MFKGNLMENMQFLISHTKKLKLLYVEDNFDAREATLMILEEFFDDIVVACDGEDGFEKFENNEIDLIITDINMPKLNGMEMSKKIRQNDIDIPILFFSAYNEAKDFLESIMLGIEGYLIKPINIEQFLVLLNKVVQKFILKEEVQKNFYLLQQYQEITDKSSIISKTDKKGIITYANDKFCEISGYSKEELIGKSHNIIRHPDMPSETFKNLWETIKDKKKIWQGIVKNRRKDGKPYYVQATIKSILDKDGNILEYIALRNDITDIMNPKKQLHDFVDISKEPMVALISVIGLEDIAKFYGQKLYNSIEDKLGVILFGMISKKIKFDNIYTLGGAEYALACEKQTCPHSEEEIIEALKIFITEVASSAISVDFIECDISLKISFAYGKKVLENVEFGMAELKEKNHSFVVANNLAKEEQYQARQNLQILKIVKDAIENRRIISYFQPIVNNKTRKIDKYESLVRLVDEKGSVKSPFLFLDVAKRGSYYPQITLMVLENSFKSLKNTNMDISMNLSVLDIERKSTREAIFRFLDTYKQYASRVVFELLEDENAKDFEAIKAFIKDIKKTGVKIAIDDFGTGFSNFERLIDYQPDILKIDGSLIKNIETSSLSMSVVKTIIAFAKEQNMQTVAEYVENENVFNILKNLGVDYSQGYYFGKPNILRNN
jgi:PAS domain S-box-containing protein